MIDIGLAFKHFDIDANSVGRAIRDVTLRIETEERADKETLVSLSESQQCEKAATIIHELLGVEVKFDNHHRAVLTTQAVVQTIVKAGGKVDDADLVLNGATQYADGFIANPAHQYFFAKRENVATATTEVAVVEGIDVKVAVKADGTIKKGGREVLAKALYERYRASPEFDATNENQPFVAILMKELGMSKAGATTYNYNLKKAMGGSIVAKPKRAK